MRSKRVYSLAAAAAVYASLFMVGTSNAQCTGTWTHLTTQPIEIEGYFTLAYNPQLGGVMSIRACRDDVFLFPSASNAWISLGQAAVGGDDAEACRPAMVWDAQRGTLVCVGTREGCDSVIDTCPGASQTWEFDGTSWYARATGFGWLFDLAGVFDQRRGQVLVHGAATPFAEWCWTGTPSTAAWNGTSWTVLTHDGPRVRGHAMTYDSLRHRTLLFGGYSSDTWDTTNNNLWAWDGTAWTLISTGGPAPRCMSGMAYDPVRDRVVLFGGWSDPFIGTGYFDTWEFDGTSWTQVASGGPVSSLANAMVYDPVRQAVLFQGGLQYGNEICEWRGPAVAPRITQAPGAQSVCTSGEGTFTVGAVGVGSLTYQWQWQPAGVGTTWVNLVAGSNSDIGGMPVMNAANVTAPTLRARPLAGYINFAPRTFRCVVTNSCGSVSSTEAMLTVCAADFNCDSSVDFFDYLDFVAAFSSQSTVADFNSDGVIDFFDYLDFVAAFSLGC